MILDDDPIVPIAPFKTCLFVGSQHEQIHPQTSFQGVMCRMQHDFRLSLNICCAATCFFQPCPHDQIYII